MSPAGLASASALQTSSRLLSTAAATLQEQLQRAPWLQLLTVPGQGRGLFAATDLEQGMVVHEEAPMLAAPSPHALDATCHQCLAPLGPVGPARSSSGSSSSGSGIPFCSSACSDDASASWAAAAAGADLRPLQQACRNSGSKFPLLAAQLALMRVQAASGCAKDSSSSSGSSSSGGSGGGEELSRGDPITQLGHLCFANVPEPPQPWRELHALLLQGLRPLCGSGSSGRSSSGGGGQDAALISASWLERELSLPWFCDVLARLHINSFRVDTVPPLDPSDPASLLRAASASLAGAAAPAHATGAAAYLLASMLNHSCEPCLDISFPSNNAVAAFTAARDIRAGEQLTISYVDSGLPLAARSAQLQFGYGFACRCPRCVEEAGA